MNIHDNADDLDKKPDYFKKLLDNLFKKSDDFKKLDDCKKLLDNLFKKSDDFKKLVDALVKNVKKIAPKVNIAMLTGQMSRSIVNDLLETKIVLKVLQKPWQESELINLIDWVANELLLRLF